MITRENCIKIGEIVKTHNLRGNVIIDTESDFLKEYVKEPVFIYVDGGLVPFYIEDVTQRNHDSYIVKLEYVDTKEQAGHLVGCDVMVEKKLVDKEKEEAVDYDIFDIEGFGAEEINTHHIGTIVDVANYTGNIVLTIQIFDKEILLPFSERYIKKVDIVNRRILVDIPQELIDLN